MELTGQQILDLGIIENAKQRFNFKIKPIDHETEFNLSGGADYSSYGLTLAEAVYLAPKEFKLAYTAERLRLPHHVTMPIVGDASIVGNTVNKSTLARLGIWQPNTDMEAGWQGYLTLELFNASVHTIVLPAGTPIATARFRCTLGVVEPYTGKYQNQPAKPVGAL